MTVSYWQYTAHREPSIEVDAAIVGGGILGCATAYWLHHLKPDWQVAVVEAHDIASGASGRNAGFLLKGTDANYAADVQRYGRTRAALLWELGRETIALIRHHLDGDLFNLRLPGSWKLAGTPEEDEYLRQSEALLREDGFEAEYYSARTVTSRLRVRHFHGGLYVPEDGVVHAVRLVRHIAERSGARLLARHPVVGLEWKQGRWHIDTAMCTIRAPRLLLALNAYLPQLLPETRPWITPRRAQMLATAPGTPGLPWPATSHQENYYFRQLNDGTWLLGGARHQHAAEEVGYADVVTDAVQQALEAYRKHHLPEAAPLPVRLRWSGTMGFSPDGLPLLDRLPEGEGYWMAGFSGHGMSWGFRAGLLAARRLAAQEDPYEALFDVRRLRVAG